MRSHITLLVLVYVFLTIVSCSDKNDCPVCPDPNAKTPPYKGWLFATSNIGEATLFKIDTETGEAVDSVLRESESFDGGFVDASRDGRFVAASLCCETEWDTNGYPIYHGHTQIFDAQTMAPVYDIPHLITPVFISSQNLLMGFLYDTVYCFSVPGFQELYRDTLPNPVMYPIPFEKDTLIYAYYGYQQDTIFAYNYVRGEIVRKWGVTNPDGGPLGVHSIALHPNGDRIYFLGADRVSAFCLFGYMELATGEVPCVFREFFSDLGDLEVSPDGREVYATDPGGPGWDYPNPGAIYIFDADDGSYIGGISLFGYGTTPGFPLPAREIEFVPTGGYAFVGSGGFGKRTGTVLMIDTQERRVINATWPETGHEIGFMAIGPKL